MVDNRVETMLRRIKLLDQLIVTPCFIDGGSEGLAVDCSNISADGEPHALVLTEPEEGIWRHDESATEGRLGHVLRAIAWSYDVEGPTDG